MKRIKGILLSAGESKRMGSPKALLKLGEKTIIENLIEEYINAVDHLVVVLGAHFEKIKQVISEKFSKVEIVVNYNYHKEMLSSVQVGFSAIKECDGVVLGLVDHPFIDRRIISTLIKEFNGENIVIPSYNKKSGHPVVLPFSLKDEIMNLDPLNHSLKDVISNHRDKVKYVEFDTDKILFDMDTIKDYERAKKLWKK